jgi:general secretion pathway protein G
MLIRTGRQAVKTGARAGFTLMELLVVIAILLVLVGVATPMYMNYLQKAKMDTARSTAKMLANQLKNYAISHEGQYPQEDDWSLIPLEQNPPLDPWHRPFHWALQASQQAEMTLYIPVVWSEGPNMTNESGAGDDITSQ